jgi:hypothetical protein
MNRIQIGVTMRCTSFHLSSIDVDDVFQFEDLTSHSGFFCRTSSGFLSVNLNPVCFHDVFHVPLFMPSVSLQTMGKRFQVPRGLKFRPPKQIAGNYVAQYRGSLLEVNTMRGSRD